MKDSCKITMVQMSAAGEAPVLDRMRPFFEQAAHYGSDLIVFPEYVLGHMLTLEDDIVQQFMRMTHHHGLYAIAGMVEKHNERFSTSAIVIDRMGHFIGRYFKSHPASGPAPHFWPPIEGAGDEARGILGCEFKVFHLDFGRIGILQCYDGYFPEAWACTSYMGAEVILWINGRQGMVEDFYTMSAAHAHGCVVGANISDGFNTGFAGPGHNVHIAAEGEREEMRMFPRLKRLGPGCVHATIDLKGLRHHRKHLRTMHQRRPEMYGLLTRDVTMWQHYPEIPWDMPECAQYVNKAQL